MPATDTTRDGERRRMLKDIRAAFARTDMPFGLDELDPRVMAALADVPRHMFVPAERRASAYRDKPLPIGLGQTISQPFIVALMTHLLRLDPASRVLEIGTGSGYQAAVLSRLAAHVYTIEIVATLAKLAAEALARFGATNVTARVGDGYGGWPSEAPFDAIIVTAAPDHVPPALVEQLARGGRLVIPVGIEEQSLMVIEKSADGTARTTTIVPVRFVPLTRES